MDAIIQFVRNALCCIKDLELFRGSFLYDSRVTSEYYGFPEPLNKTTPLEIFISITQFYACVSVATSGYRLINESGLGKLRRIRRLNELDAVSTRNKSNPLVHEIIQESLQKERTNALRSLFVGVNVISIGIAFFWLFCNSLHVTETNWIGGLPFLIHALTVMEIGLVPLLYYMFLDGIEQISKSERMVYLSGILKKSQGGVSAAIVNEEIYGMIVHGGWSPFWSNGYNLLESLPDELDEEEKFNSELSRLETTLDTLLGEKIITARRTKAMTTTLQETASRLQEEAYVTRLEGYREFVYLVINYVAFYGYLLGIIGYYFDREDVQPFLINIFKFGLSNADADWHGNFAGDFMWTIEPFVILGTPPLFGWLTPKIAKVKAD